MAEDKILKDKVNAAWKAKSKVGLWGWSVVLTIVSGSINSSSGISWVSVIATVFILYSIFATISHWKLKRKITKEYKNGRS